MKRYVVTTEIGTVEVEASCSMHAVEMAMVPLGIDNHDIQYCGQCEYVAFGEVDGVYKDIVIENIERL